MSFAAGLSAWQALLSILLIAFSVWAFGRTLFVIAKGLYTQEYPQTWQRRHKLAFHAGELIIAVLTVILWYDAFKELLPLVRAALSGGNVDPNIDSIVFKKVGLPCLFWSEYEAVRWRRPYSGIKLWTAFCIGYLVATLAGLFN